MTSFFPFSSSSTSLTSSTSALVSDDPHLQVTVTPAASAFYAGESFSVTITFKNTRNPPTVPTIPSTAPTTAQVVSAVRPTPPIVDRHVNPPRLPVRAHRMGQTSSVEPFEPINGDNAEAGPSRTPDMLSLASPDSQELPRDYPYSPGANPAFRAPGWPSKDDGATIRSPEAWRRREYGDIGKGLGHGRRTRSLAIGKAVSPQEMVWALEGHSAPTPPSLPSRRPQGAPIPTNHPHSRKESIAAALLSPPGTTAQLPSGSSDLPSIPERPGLQSSRGTSRSTSRPSSRNTNSAASSRSRVDLTDDESRTSSDITASHPRRPGSSPYMNHSRTPSYHNAYGASLMGILAQPPPSHPYIRSQEPRGTTTILWAYTRLVAHFHPSNTHIPPDPLLPLRSMLLHQPVGSGSLMPGSSSLDTANGMKPSSSRWEFSFGTGTIGQETQPSLTGSLFGLAKGLVTGGSGGTLEEERKRVWNMKDLPVLETTRSLLGVDVKLKEGEEKAFTYTLPIPINLPPAYRGKAFRFSYDLVVSVNVALPGKGNKQRNKEVQVPIRIWANVSLSQPNRAYDILKPIIQTRDEGVVDEAHGHNERKVASMERTRSKAGDTQKSLEVYAKHLLGAVDPASPPRQGKVRIPPLSPSRVHPRGRILSPSSPVLDLPDTSVNAALSVPDTIRKNRHRQGSFIEGDDELVEETGEGGCGEAVEVLSRHAPKISYDIAKDGHLVAVLTLIKSTYRLGESVLGVVTFNQPRVERRVLKFSAFLESHEIIPENLLPPSTGPNRQPPIQRLHAEHASSYALHTSRLAFSLDIPSEATPSFALAAGPDGYPGGLEWRVRLSFLVSVPRKHTRGPGHSLVGVSASHADNDNKLFAATTSLAPVHRNPEARDGDEAVVVGKTEVMDVEIPVKVLAGNTAFLVKPSVHVV